MNKQIAQDYYTRMDSAKGDFTKLKDLFNDDFTIHFPGAPGPLSLDQFQGMAEGIYAGFSNFTHKVLNQISEDDMVCTRVEVTGTHDGSFQGIPASQKEIKIQGITTHRIKDGKLSEHWVSVDFMGLMQQIGALPTPA